MGELRTINLRIRRASLLAPVLALCGCERAPSVNVLGAFFPSWMLCVIIGIVLALVARQVLVVAGLDTWVGPRGLVYPALALAFTLAAWLAFFKG
ncbi:MAG TPA: YtcA family lipoprotein [Burkholderiales bacterium]|nr:YtcA family lipoprotein [Burkholderiales bacterium]